MLRARSGGDHRRAGGGAVLTDLDARVRLAVLESFLRGERPSVANVARDVADSEAEVGAAFERLAAGRAFLLEPGTRDIRMAAPFSGVPTDHRVHIGGREYFANCIWDALGIPAMLAAAGRPSEARVETRCLDCGAELALAVDADRVVAESPGLAPVAHFAVPAAGWWADIVFT
ncbi:MAG TPA: organomercurial lyase [Gemmatimonadaceae bacterium]|nr:organomercurial lyase [Gemmatimonadaceae bacterium]